MIYLLAFGAAAMVLVWTLRTRAYRALARRRHARCLAHINELEFELGMSTDWRPRARIKTPRQAAAHWQAAQRKAQNYSVGGGASQEQWAAAIHDITVRRRWS